MILSNGFLSILNISIAGVVTACVLLLIKKILGERLSASWHYYIWLILVIKLIVPVFPQSQISIFNIVKLPFQQQYEMGSDIGVQDKNVSVYADKPRNDIMGTSQNTGQSQHINLSDDGITDSDTPAQDIPLQEDVKMPGDIIEVLSIIWIAGIFLVLLYTTCLNIHIRRSVAKRGKCDNNELLDVLLKCKDSLGIKKRIAVHVCDRFGSPCIYGLIRPKLLVSNKVISNLSQTDKKYVLMHELMHLKRKDMIINTILILLKAVYWFNPVLWYCFADMRRECEISCDEMVLRRLDRSERIRYGKTIVDMSAYYPEKKFLYPVMNMVNKKSDTSKRIKKVINFKKQPTIWIIIAIIIATLICAAVLTNGTNNPPQETAKGNPNSEESTGNTENDDMRYEGHTVNESLSGNSNEDDLLLEQYFNTIYDEIDKGHSIENAKEKFSSEYDYIVSKGFDAFGFLKQQIYGSDAASRRRKTAAAEWLMSDIIKLQSGEEYKH